MKLKLLLLVLALQTAWVVGTVFQQERALHEGKVILLETRPVDPRDLLRGDYVILSYKISDVPLNLFTPVITKTPPPGQTIFVALEPRGEFYEVVQASTEKLPATANQVVLRGKCQNWWNRNSAVEKTVRVEYGLERYYVREGTGNPQGKLTAQVAVPVSGQGVIKQLFVDGKPYAEVMKRDAR